MIEVGLAALLEPIAPTYPGYLPEGVARPAISYGLASASRSQTHDGSTGVVAARFGIAAHGDTHAAARALAAAIVSALLDYSGELDGVTVANTEVDDEQDLGWAEDSGAWVVLVEATCHYYEE